MRNPFVGLRPFRSTEEELFFGRSKEISVLRDLALTVPVLIVYAPSGTGKSSLINAGLIPVIRNIPSMVDVTIADPHQDPEEAVLDALRERGWDSQDEINGMQLAELLEKHYQETDTRVIVVLDQFEERIKQSNTLDSLFGQIAKLANTRSEAATIIISIRDDYVAGLDQLMRRVSGLLDAGYRVPPLSRDALVEAVIRPLSLVDERITVEPGLIDEVLTDLEQHSAAEVMDRRIEPGYFQIVWSRLWTLDADTPERMLTFRSYHAEGGVNEILKSFVTRILDDLLPYEAALLHASLRYMVLPTGAKVALTIDDLIGLLRRDDISFGFDRLLYVPDDSPEAPGPYPDYRASPDLPKVFDSIFEELTRSDAPLFRRVQRGKREEFELMHDLLGIILNEWRRDYVKAQEVRLNSVRSGIPSPEKRPAVSATAELLQEAVDHASSGQWSAITDEKTASALRLAFVLLSSADQIPDAGKLAELDRLVDSFQEKIKLEAFRNPDRDVRRVLQWYAWEIILETSRRVPIGERPKSSPFVPLLMLTCLGAAAGVGAYLSLLVSGIISSLPVISYEPLTLSVVATGAAVMYLVIDSDSSSDTVREELRNLLSTLWPTPQDYFSPPSAEPSATGARRRRAAFFKWIRWARVLVWWPIIFGIFMSLCYAGAVAFKAAGWSPTAGFNFAAVIAAIVLGFSYLIGSDF